MRNTPLPFFKVDTEKLKSGFEKEQLKKSFKTLKEKRKERPETFKEAGVKTRKEARDNIKGKKGKERKLARFEAAAEAKKRKEIRQSERMQNWAEKNVLKGKFDSVEEAKKRYASLREMTDKKRKALSEILGEELMSQNTSDPDDETYDSIYPSVTLENLNKDIYSA